MKGRHRANSLSSKRIQIEGCHSRISEAEQKVAVDVLDQHPLGERAVDRLESQGQQQQIQRYRAAPSLGIELAGGRIKPIKI